MSDWTPGEIEVVTAAVDAAPSVHNTQPWRLDFHRDGVHGVSLLQRADRALPRHDPLGRDRLISCGAALENLVLAMRTLGWVPRTLPADPQHADEVAHVVATDRQPPSDEDSARYAAIPSRRTCRRPFADVQVDAAVRDALVTASDITGVEVRALHGERAMAVLAGLFEHAALVLKADRAYQRELSAWTVTGPVPSPGEGVADVPARLATLPWAGLVRRSTALPDQVTLAARLGRECLLVVETPDDGPRDQVRTGMAMQATWLAATASGLVGSVLTQPLQVREVRAGLIEGLGLAGFPQALMRFGHDSKEEPS